METIQYWQDHLKKTGYLASILVVDDDDDNRGLLALRLRDRNFRVEEASCGQDALEQMEAEPFDIVLLDIMMPGMNGYQVLETLKTNKRLSYIPIIVLSALDEMDSVVRCIELGAEDYILKPINNVLLQARISASLEKKRLRDREQAYIRLIENEMRVGRDIQTDFLPDNLPELPGWEIAKTFIPARDVSGDFYDVCELEDGKIMLVVADVCGKGVGAAIFMAVMRSLLRAFSDEITQPTDISRVAIKLNEFIFKNQRQRNINAMFITIFLGLLDPDTGELTYINGGHPCPHVVSTEGEIELLSSSGPAVGLKENVVWKNHKILLKNGEKLVAFTDGVSEALNKEMEFFEGDPLHTTLRASPETARGTLDAIKTALDDFTSNEHAHDDITMLALRRSSGN